MDLPDLAGVALKRVQQAQLAFNEALYDSRAVLPEMVFQLAHEMKTPSMEIALQLEQATKAKAEEAGFPPEELEGVEENLRTIEALFTCFVEYTRGHIGVDDASPNTAAPPVGERRR